MDDLIQNTQNRKDDHIRINLNDDVRSTSSNGFDNYYFLNNALPELDLEKVDTKIRFLEKELSAPLLISSMTGGTAEGLEINKNLAIAAEHAGIAMGLGSQRAGLESSEVAKTYSIRKWAPNLFIMANVGAIQLNYGYGIEECKRAVAMAEANALILHLNPLQEALQPEGQTNFAGLARKIENICKSLEVPVIIKEVGWGISAKTARALFNLGVACVDVAGAGGTSWSQVEKYRNTSEARVRISSHFQDWGIPTAEALHAIHVDQPTLALIASGGLRKGLDLAKSVALGASLGGIAGGFLKAATVSSEAVKAVIDEVLLELRITMFAVGAATIAELKNTPILRRG
jgi:isopentenyl-diphosphate delta-isomerase